MSRTPEPLLRLTISGMHCASCVAGVEQGLRMVEGVEEARVNLVTREVFIRGRASAGEDLARRVRRAIEDMGYSVEESSELGPTGDNSPLVADPRKSWLSRMMGWLCQDGKRARAVVAGVLAIPVVAIGMAHVRGTVPDLLGLILTMGIFAVSWRPVIQPGLRCLVRRPDMNALVALGTLAAFLASAWAVGLALFGSWGAAHSGHDGGMATGSGAGLGGVYFEAAAVTLAAVLLGRWIETQCLRRAASALKDLDERIPTTAFRLAVSGAEEIVPVGELAVGDRVLIRPGDLIPTDGVVVLGQGEVDESLLTGESLPVMKKRGDAVAGGTLNGSGHFQIKVTAPAGQSAAARLAEAVRQAQMDRPRLQRMADRAAAVFVPTVMVLALATVCGWLMTGSSWSDALPYGIAVLVVACPCALGLATPAAVMAATARAAKEGVLYRDADALERLARCRLVVLDKTGTVTLGQPKLVEVVGEDGDGWLKAVAALETCSEHVWARAVVAGLAERGIVAGGGRLQTSWRFPGMGCMVGWMAFNIGLERRSGSGTRLRSAGRRGTSWTGCRGIHGPGSRWQVAEEFWDGWHWKIGSGPMQRRPWDNCGIWDWIPCY